MFKIIWNAVTEIWNLIKHYFVQLMNFFKNIVSFFKNPNRLDDLKKHKEKIAVVVKEKLASGEYETVQCLFNTETNELTENNDDIQTIKANELDQDTQKQFNGKDMIVLQ